MARNFFSSAILFVLVRWSIYFVCNGKQYKNAGQGYSLRMTSINGCGDYPSNPEILYVKFVTYNNSQYANAAGTLREAIHINEVRLMAYRCLDYNYGCEPFLNWTVPNACTILRMKNQAWTPIADSVVPNSWKHTCPLIEKGTYTLTNTTLDLRAAIQLVPDIEKYKWRIKYLAADNKQKITMCLLVEGHIFTYTKRINLEP